MRAGTGRDGQKVSDQTREGEGAGFGLSIVGHVSSCVFS